MTHRHTHTHTHTRTHTHTHAHTHTHTHTHTTTTTTHSITHTYTHAHPSPAPVATSDDATVAGARTFLSKLQAQQDEGGRPCRGPFLASILLQGRVLQSQVRGGDGCGSLRSPLHCSAAVPPPPPAPPVPLHCDAHVSALTLTTCFGAFLFCFVLLYFLLLVRQPSARREPKCSQTSLLASSPSLARS